MDFKNIPMPPWLEKIRKDRGFDDKDSFTLFYTPVKKSYPLIQVKISYSICPYLELEKSLSFKSYVKHSLNDFWEETSLPLSVFEDVLNHKEEILKFLKKEIP